MDPLSPRNSRVQAVRRLARQPRERAERRAFVIEGPTLVAEAIDSAVRFDAVFYSADAPDGIVDRALGTGADGVLVSAAAIAAIATTTTPQPILAVARMPEREGLEAFDRSRPGHVLVLDRIQDPGNAGTILRSAEASGAAAVVFAAGSVDLYNPKVVRASAGSIFRVTAFQGSELTVASALEALGESDRARFATAADGDIDYETADLANAAILLGNEAGGVDTDDLWPLDGVLRIPHAGPTESLNVAMAATVLCFEAARQRRSAS